MRRKLKAMVLGARCLVLGVLCAVGLAAFAKEPDAVQLWKDGPYFATCNVGADKPEDYGSYFWWGDTVGYVTNGLSGTDAKWVSVDGSETTIRFNSSDATATYTYKKADGVLATVNGIGYGTVTIKQGKVTETFSFTAAQ